MAADGSTRNARILDLYEFHGLERQKVDSAGAGDIVVFSGSDNLAISDTLCPRDHPEGLPALAIDEPTISAWKPALKILSPTQQADASNGDRAVGP